MKSFLRQKLRWELLGYAIGSCVLRILYANANRLFKTGGASGMDLSGLWWLVAALYFAADVILFTIVITFRNPRSGMNVSPKRPFLYYASEVIPALFMLHLAYLTFEYRISSRLEGVGLGPLETISFLGAMITIGAWIFRSFEIAERPETVKIITPVADRLQHGS